MDLAGSIGHLKLDSVLKIGRVSSSLCIREELPKNIGRNTCGGCTIGQIGLDLVSDNYAFLFHWDLLSSKLPIDVDSEIPVLWNSGTATITGSSTRAASLESRNT